MLTRVLGWLWRSDSAADIGGRGLVGRGRFEESSNLYGSWPRRAVPRGVGVVALVACSLFAGACGGSGGDTLAEPEAAREPVVKRRTTDTRLEEIINFDQWHGYVLDVAWSPDGSRILITGDKDSVSHENMNVYVVDANGSNMVQLTDWPGEEWGVWSPDGSRILITGRSDAGEDDLYVMDVDGSNLVQLTDWPGNERGVWSPDGSSILITYPTNWSHFIGLANLYSGSYSYRNVSYVEEYEYDLYVVDADGSNMVQLTDWPGEEWGVWSPDGSRILITGNADIDSDWEYDLYVVDVDGSNLVQLTDWPGIEYSAEWSSNGSNILITYEGDLYSVNADELNSVQLTDQSDSERGVWSPDGSRILMISNSDAWEDDLYVVDADGSNRVQLTDWPGAERGVWSPDSSRILITGVHYLGDVHVVNTDGSNLVRLTDWPGDWIGPEHMLGWWSPDGSRILIIGDSNDHNWDLYVVDVDSLNLVQLTDWSESAVGWWSPDGSHILVLGDDDSDGFNDVYVMRLSS